MEKKLFNRELYKRFVNDNNLPIPILRDDESFFYYINLYEDLYGSKTLYENVCNEIAVSHNGSGEEFLNDYSSTRDNIIKDILAHPKYVDFIEADMSKFNVSDKLKSVSRGNVYNEENIGKVFLSIDLKEANFQAIHYYDKSIVKGEKTYSEFVSHYTSSEYFQNSKYTRQVIFGKCNAGRQITIEKHLISKFYDEFTYDTDKFELVKFNNDELVFEIKDFDIFPRENIIIELKKNIQDASRISGVQVTYKIYTLQAVKLFTEKSGKYRNTNYVLVNSDHTNSNDWDYKFKDVPQTYHAIIYKLLNKMELDKYDYCFNYEGLDAILYDTFSLKVIKNKKDLYG